MTPTDLAADLRARINPAYASQLGTESYERRECAEVIEKLVAECGRLRDQIHTCGPTCSKAGCINGRLRDELAAMTASRDEYQSEADGLAREIKAMEELLDSMISGAANMVELANDADRLAAELKSLRDSGVELPESTQRAALRGLYTESQLRDYGDRRAMSASRPLTNIEILNLHAKRSWPRVCFADKSYGIALDRVAVIDFVRELEAIRKGETA